MKEFGRLAYKDTVYINFDSNSMMADLFSYDLNVERLIMGIELFTASYISWQWTWYFWKLCLFFLRKLLKYTLKVLRVDFKKSIR